MHAISKLQTFPDGLQLRDVKVGTGQAVKKNDQVSIQYTGWLANGTKFDSSRDRGTAFDVTIGQGQVIAGWDEGVPAMKVGGIRRLTIPARLGSWYAKGGFQYYHIINDNLLLAQTLVGTASTFGAAHKDVVVGFAGVGFSF